MPNQKECLSHKCQSGDADAYLRRELLKVGISKGFKVVFSEELPVCAQVVLTTHLENYA